MNTVIIGIDISKKKFDVAYMTINQQSYQRTFDNTLEGFKGFFKYLESRKIEKCHAVMEATGRYGEDLVNFIIFTERSGALS